MATLKILFFYTLYWIRDSFISSKITLMFTLQCLRVYQAIAHAYSIPRWDWRKFGIIDKLTWASIGKTFLSLEFVKMPNSAKKCLFEKFPSFNFSRYYTALTTLPYWNWKGSEPKSRLSSCCWGMLFPGRVLAEGRGRVSGSTPSWTGSMRLLTSVLTLR